MRRRKTNKPRRSPSKKKQQCHASNQAAPAPHAPPVIKTNGEAEIHKQQPERSSDPPAEQEQPEQPIRIFDRRIWGRSAIFVELMFAGAVAYFAYIQAVVTEGQLDVMRKGIAQTDTIIEQMRQDQRPWLVASDPERIQFEAGKEILCRVALRNTGNTTGTLTHAVLSARVIENKEAIPDFLKEVAANSKRNNRNTPLPPQTVIFFNMGDSGLKTVTVASDNDDQSVADGSKILCLGGVFAYMDNTNTLRVTTCCFIWESDRSGFVAYQQYNEMD